MSGDAHQLVEDGIAREILAYLSTHPDARDTMEGIITWWLLEGRIKTNQHLASSALKELVSKGYVRKVKRRDSPGEYYSINKDKNEEITKYLKSFK